MRRPRHPILLVVVFFIFLSHYAPAQITALAEFTVHAGSYDRLNTPVSVNLNGVDLPEDWTRWELMEQQGGEMLPVAMQWQPGPQGTLSWILTGETPAGSTRRFSLRQRSGDNNEAPLSSPEVTTNDHDGAVVFSVQGNDVLTYQYTLAEVPDGVERYLPPRRFYSSPSFAGRGYADAHSAARPLPPLRPLEPLDTYRVPRA